MQSPFMPMTTKTKDEIEQLLIDCADILNLRLPERKLILFKEKINELKISKETLKTVLDDWVITNQKFPTLSEINNAAKRCLHKENTGETCSLDICDGSGYVSAKKRDNNGDYALECACKVGSGNFDMLAKEFILNRLY